jgi:hypothetical protein
VRTSEYTELLDTLATERRPPTPDERERMERYHAIVNERFGRNVAACVASYMGCASAVMGGDLGRL